MLEPRVISQEEYDEFRARMEEKYGYDDMSEEEKVKFDEKIDQVAVVDGRNDNTDASDFENTDGKANDKDRTENEDDEEKIY